jgi:hypothetical protein
LHNPRTWTYYEDRRQRHLHSPLAIALDDSRGNDVIAIMIYRKFFYAKLPFVTKERRPPFNVNITGWEYIERSMDRMFRLYLIHLLTL